MRRSIALMLLTLAVLSPGGPAAAAPPLAITRESQRDVMVTIYNGNLGLVKDTREARLPAGTIEVQFMDVAAQIDPTSVHLKSLTDPAGLRSSSRTTSTISCSAQKLLEKYVGRKVRLYQGNGTYHEATLLSTNGPGLRHQRPDPHGPLRPASCCPSLPENLVSKPTLVWLLRNAATAPQRVEASYLTGGITWKADYVMVINAADDRADLTGWVTIDNKSGATYKDAALKLVAGDVNRAREDRTRQADGDGGEGRRRRRRPPATSSPRASSSTTSTRSTAGPRSRTSRPSSSRSCPRPTCRSGRSSSTTARATTTARSTACRCRNQKVGVYLELTQHARRTTSACRCRRARCASTRRTSPGSQQLIGEDWIDHTPKDERVRIKMGEAFDVVGERTQKDWKKIGGSTYEVEWEISLRNHKKEDVVVR